MTFAHQLKPVSCSGLLVVISLILIHTASAADLKRVTLQLKWYHQFQFAGYYAAKEMGFYEAAGLDVEIIEGGPGIKVQTAVVDKKADFGVLGSELLYFRAQGLDLVVLAPIIQHSIRVIIAGRGISSPHDLVKQTIMLNENELPEFSAMFLNEGVDVKGIDIIDKDRSANQKFIAGTIDAINGSMANQPFLFKEKKIPYTLIKPIHYGIDFYGDSIFTTGAFLDKEPELASAFMTASFKGWKYAFDHPEAVIDLIIETYNAKKSRAHLVFEKEQLERLMHPDLVEIGHNNPARWEHIAQTYKRLGLIENDFSIKGLLYQDYQTTDAVWKTRLIMALALVGLLLCMVFLWNSLLRRKVRQATREIEESKENLRIILHSIGDAVIAVDLEGEVLTMNPVAERLTGWPIEDARGEPLSRVFHIIHSKSRLPAENPVDKVLSKGKVVGLANHTALIARDGSEYQIADSGAPIKDSHGRITGVVMVFRDMTEEYRVQEKIISMGKFPSENPAPVLRVTPEGVLLYANEGSRPLLEFWDSRISGAIPEKWAHRIAGAMKEDKVLQFEQKLPDRFFSLVLKPVKEMNYVNIYGLDITLQKGVEQALSKSKSYLQTLIKTIPDLVWLKDPKGVYLFCNARFERFFGASESDIVGKTDYDFVDRELADFFREKDKIAAAKGGPSLNEETVTYADDGHQEILETIKTPMFDNGGELIGVLGIARDITGRRQAEDQRKKLEEQLRQSHKMEAIGTIAGGIAHDFNNILGIIIGNMELAIDSIREGHPARMNLEEIKNAGLRASDVVKQLLNFSRKSEKSKEIIDLGLIVREAVKLLRSSIPTSVDIQLNLPDAVMRIDADPTQVHQVLINLCTNAAHAMENSGGRMEIEISEIELGNVTRTQFQDINPGHYVMLTISDTGKGIASGIQAKIFDPYFTTKAVGKGTGMGLAVVMGIVKNHNGGISVYSEPGHGSTFKVLFPKATEEVDHGKKIIKEIPKGNERILFVDDEEGLVEIGSRILKKLGYRVVTKTDPVLALNLFQADPFAFDLVITDMTMPRLSGEDLVREIKAVNPTLPVILCTGFSSRIDPETAAAAGVSQYIEKPLDRKSLAASVRKALDGKHE